ncbi:schwannomin-interacting protein 1 [Nerophis lumbriciformis]|uniref:schwannomin-interacting protein 1 n=1 Tax=Nerophis lumbriciformis TaxID=546530 RepID=UPI002ADF9987|nr:schwannomin-interacting protein 1-like [Nerophis lumbriciformis]XP_061815976.1 schwannomin-interacting protein 1-like [Nerophis lumbriciformis]
MEGEKERQRQQGEEKESNEADDGIMSGDDDVGENDDEDSEGAALVWQEGYSEDNLGLPIMHWEALSLRIAELEKQEEEKKEKMAKSQVSLERSRAPVSWTGERGRRRESCDDDDDEACNSHMTALSSRLQTQMNLQLCFINDSESEEEDAEKEDDVRKKRGSIPVHKSPQPTAKPEKTKSRGFRNTWKKLRDRLRADHKPLTPAANDSVVQRRHLERSDLQNYTMKELTALCSSLRQTIQDLSTELVGRLQMRDQLRTEQDAMLLEVQDLTSLGTLLSNPS